MRQERSLRVQIFATDLDLAAIETARAGVYPSGIAADVTPERLRRWFVQEDGHYRVKKDIRDLVIFAPHDLLMDPPFTKLDLLSCRNLLIYLESRAQRRLMPLFHYALKPGGLLFLGASESIDQHEDLFSTVDRKWKIFRRVNARRQALEGFPIGRGKTRPVEAPPADRREVAGGSRPRHASSSACCWRAPGNRAWSWTSAARPSTSPAEPVSIWSPRPASRRTVCSRWRGRGCATT